MTKKYRLGNQPEEYELNTNYLGWTPKSFTEWQDWIWERGSVRKSELIITSPDKSQEVDLVMHQVIIKDAFPLAFFGEERAKPWHRFCIVSLESDTSDEFIIPLH